MRHLLISLSLLVTFAAQADLGPIRPSPIPPGSFLLKCRGGASPRISYEMNAAAHSFRLFVMFKPSPKPASAGLNPGDCAWVDRGFRANEPKQLCQENVDQLRFQAPHSHDARYTPSDLWMLSASSDKAPYLAKAQAAGQYFDLYVMASGPNCLNVTGWPR